MSSSLAKLGPIEAIQSEHQCQSFDCGNPVLNEWLKRYALANQRSGGARTFVIHAELQVKAYYSLASGNVLKREGPKRLGSGLGNYPIPIILLARLAVDLSLQRLGVGRALLRDVMLRVIRISEDVGVRALVVDAINEDARNYYIKNGFVAFPEDRMRLMQLTKDLQAIVNM